MGKSDNGGLDPRLGAKKERRRQVREARKLEVKRQERVTSLRRLGFWFAGIVAVLAIIFFIVRGTGGGVSVAGNLRDGGKLDSFSLPRLEGAGTITYASLQEKPLVLNFFASWCPFCISEMPAFEQVNQRLGSRVQFLGVSQSDGKQASSNLAHQTGISYPTAIDAQGSLFRAFGGSGMPVTVFIRPGGQIAEIHTGALDQAALTSLIQRYFQVS